MRWMKTNYNNIRINEFSFLSLYMKTHILVVGYRKVRTFEYFDIVSQFIHWNVSNVTLLLERWNNQPESLISNLKWSYKQLEL